MPLQNRVTPFSTIESSTARGSFLGNRGILHGDRRNLLTQGWRTKAWIICTLNYKRVRRVPMTPGTWTELFFLDEAVALAAGHRPCGFCRRPRFKAFLQAAGFQRAPELDRVLHAERTAKIKPQTGPDLPNGAFVAYNSGAWLMQDGILREWTHEGYKRQMQFPPNEPLTLLTPPTTVRALRNGYLPD